MTHDELIEKVAKAINGPFHPTPEGSLFTLDQLRDIRWQQINGAERNLCVAGAKAAISTILAALQEPKEGMLLAANGFGDTQAWQEMLAASALGEQAE